MINRPNTVCPTKHTDIEIPHCSRDHVFVPDTIKIPFNLDIESADNIGSIVKMLVEHW